MEPKKAIEVLLDLRKKYQLAGPEDEAVLAAVGVLDCANLAESRMKRIIKAKKAGRIKDMEP